MAKKKKAKKKTKALAKPGPAPGAVPAAPSSDEATPIVPPPVPPAQPPIVRVPDRSPDRSSTEERRLFRRVPFFRRVEYKFETIDEFRKEHANDISLGGMFIKTEKPEPLGTVLYLQFDLKDGSPILHGYGKVVRVNPPDIPDLDPGMGIEFLKFDDESLARIRTLVSDRFNA